MQIVPGSGSCEYISFTLDDDCTVMGFTIPMPSNFHAHLRYGPLMRAIARHLMQHALDAQRRA